MKNDIFLHQDFLFDGVGSSSWPNKLQGIGLIVDDVALEVEVVWKVRFSTLIVNQHKWASYYHDFVVWDFFSIEWWRSWKYHWS